ncbi:MAG: hypothetical protein U5P10_13165 [Spirochaetia bacterium]|nr:hypothetical protein [Spirochaetia bacterium]
MDRAVTKQYEVVYIVSARGLLVGKIEDFSFDEMWKLKHISPVLSNGDLLRCFTAIGSVDTYVLEIEESCSWPPVFSIRKTSVISYN